ncbi:MAG: hypothetical protein CME06_06920 [Gemmatimonadetes bacterium]|nr:hypothetical protein [Gemmatimonadota bacterium]
MTQHAGAIVNHAFNPVNDMRFHKHSSTEFGGIRAISAFGGAVLALTLLAAEPSTANPLHVDGRTIVDGAGRQVILRGANVSGATKTPPFLPLTETTWFDNLEAWGFNLVRLLISWEALEPDPGFYRTRYLDAIEELVDGAADRGLYVVLDMHQDLYARPFSGDGAPTWAIPADVDWSSFEPKSIWPLNYATPEVNRCFSAFWADEDGVQSAYLDAWRQVVARVAEHPALIGYDPINEPWAGFTGARTADRDLLQPFYDRFHEEIREPIDPDAILFLEPNGWTVSGPLAPSFRPFDYENVVLNVHWYDTVPMTVGVYTPFGRWRSTLRFQRIDRWGESLGLPVWVSEFGIGFDVIGHAAYLNDQYELLDAHQFHSAQWEYEPGWAERGLWNGEDMSMLDENDEPRNLEQIVRPFARALPGRLIRSKFRRWNRRFSLRYRSNGGGEGEAEIFIAAETQYPNGFEVQISDGTWSYSADGLLRHRPAEGVFEHEIVVHR